MIICHRTLNISTWMILCHWMLIAEHIHTNDTLPPNAEHIHTNDPLPLNTSNSSGSEYVPSNLEHERKCNMCEDDVFITCPNPSCLVYLCYEQRTTACSEAQGNWRSSSNSEIAPGSQRKRQVVISKQQVKKGAKLWKRRTLESGWGTVAVGIRWEWVSE